MDATSHNFFLLLLFGAIIAYGLAPAYAPALVILLCLWLIADFFIALVAGFGFGLGFRRSRSRRSLRDS